MIKIIEKGNIFNSTAEALVNPVNCVGVAGKGLALQFKTRFPGNFLFYKKCCDRNQLRPGKILTFTLSDRLVAPFYIMNFPTKDCWRNPSRMEWIDSGMNSLLADCSFLNIKSIAIPPLGCGLGNLKWEDVSSLIIKKMENSTTSLYLYSP